FGPRPDEGGYRGRFARGVMKLLEENPIVLSRKYADAKEREFFVSGIKEGNWSRTFLKFDELKKRLKPVADGLAIHSVNTDVGVTQDLSKLIRVPNSIHGETGLVAKIIEDIKTFDPWKDAVLENQNKNQTTNEMKVKFVEDVPQLELGADTVGPFKKGEERVLSQHLALLFVCKESAMLV
ncbi:MAG: hypothetical protein PHF60_04805, partial [Candidatus ainarchaeum sp.]|nr:hypothetical protein [Candidatus ainarchaeum sp.]